VDFAKEEDRITSFDSEQKPLQDRYEKEELDEIDVPIRRNSDLLRL
jgi:hypothetical protein